MLTSGCVFVWVRSRAKAFFCLGRDNFACGAELPQTPSHTCPFAYMRSQCARRASRARQAADSIYLFDEFAHVRSHPCNFLSQCAVHVQFSSISRAFQLAITAITDVSLANALEALAILFGVAQTKYNRYLHFVPLLACALLCWPLAG